MARKQCKHCPWKVSTDPHDIPNGYCETKHRNLRRTISKAPDTRALTSSALHMMACHETREGKELPCVGWLAHQLGPGNNLGLRFAVMTGKVDGDFELDGPQHATFEDTLP